MQIRPRTKKFIYAGLIGAAIMLLIAGVAGYFWYTHTQEKQLAQKKQYQERMEELSRIAEEKNMGYSLNTNVKRGERITEDMLEPVYLADAASPINMLEDFQFEVNRYYARADLSENTVIIDSLVYINDNVQDDIRSTEYAVVELPTKLKKDDYVDVRIQFPNGEDYIIFSKKKVMDVSGVTLWLENDEGEILSMSSAMVDAFLNEGKLYALPYVDGEMQQASEITYPVNKAVLDLINRSPNIVNTAKLNLEKQNRASLENNLRELDAQQAEKVRQKESEYDAVKKQEDQERALIEANESTIYDSEIVNDDIGGGEE